MSTAQQSHDHAHGWGVYVGSYVARRLAQFFVGHAVEREALPVHHALLNVHLDRLLLARQPVAWWWPRMNET